MSRVKCLVMATALLVSLGLDSARAESAGGAFGNLTTARTVGMGKGFWGVGVGVADATSFFGTFTYGMSESFDGRAKFGFVDGGNNTDTELSIGFDAKYQMLTHGGASNNPFDMALGGMFEWADYGPVSLMQFGFFTTGSYPFAMSNGRALSPYVRANVRIEDISVDGGNGSSDLELGLNAGVHYELSKNVGLYGEFQLDGNDGLFFGLDFNVL